MDRLFITSFWFTNGMLLIALTVLYFILTNRRSMERKGYNERYISYLRKSHTIRILTIAIVLPVLELISAGIIYLLTGPLTEEIQLAYIVVLLVVLVVPFKLTDEYMNRKMMKKLAIETKEKVAIDLNYKTLHLIFNPALEIVLTLASLLYGLIILKIEQWIIYLFLLFPWLMYLTMRGTRYQTRPYLQDNYKYMYAFNLFSFLFFFAYFFTYLMIRLNTSFEQVASSFMYEPAESLPDLALLAVGFLLAVILLGRISVYLANYKRFSDEINGSFKPTSFQAGRQIIFFASAMFLLLAVSGIGMATDLFKGGQTEVGVVMEKYIVKVSGGKEDTVAILDNQGYRFIKAGYENQFNTYDRNNITVLPARLDNKDLKAYCTIRLSLSNKIEKYEMCCADGINLLPFETVIKFEYKQGNRITGIIDF